MSSSKLNQAFTSGTFSRSRCCLLCWGAAAFSILFGRGLTAALLAPLSQFENHCELGILIANVLLGEVELLHEESLEFHHDHVARVLVLEVVQARILGLPVSAQQQSDAD